MLKGNRGEWSEVYAFFKLMADGRLYAGDARLNKICNVYYPIIKALRSQPDGDYEYIRNGDIRVVDGRTGKVLIIVSVTDFIENARTLLSKIRSGQGAFEVPEIHRFAESIYCTKLKGQSQEKRDITLVVHDFNTGLNPELGFSIKSMLGQSSSLLNASASTKFIYRVAGNIEDDEIRQINRIASGSTIRERVASIMKCGRTLEFVRTANDIFGLNMQLIDSSLPLIMATVVLSYYNGSNNNMKWLAQVVESKNPCQYVLTHAHKFYEYKIKNFLTDIALGMQPATVWNGRYDATGGIIVVKEDGDVVCYHVYNRNEFQNYLLTNTKLDTPSSSRHHFGFLYRDGANVYFDLALQIRFTS